MAVGRLFFTLQVAIQGGSGDSVLSLEQVEHRCVWL